VGQLRRRGEPATVRGYRPDVGGVGIKFRWVAVIVACSLFGCTSNESGAPKVIRAHGTPALADALSGPSTPIGDGFSVPAGASLIGTALPDSPITGYPGVEARRAWSALLLVDGDAVAVVHELMQQAAAKGMQGPESMPYLSCVQDYCQAGAAIPRIATAPGSVVRTLYIGMSPRASLVTISYRDFDPSRTATAVDPPPKEPPLPRPPALRAVERPGVADRINLAPPACVRLDPCSEAQLRRTEVRVQSGSEPLAPAFCDACYDSDVLLMRVGDGERVLDAYSAATAMLDAWEGAPQRSTDLRDGWTVRTAGFGNTDTSVSYELFRRDGSPQYLRLSLSNGA
jgi:hypothetical protein